MCGAGGKGRGEIKVRRGVVGTCKGGCRLLGVPVSACGVSTGKTASEATNQLHCPRRTRLGATSSCSTHAPLARII